MAQPASHDPGGTSVHRTDGPGRPERLTGLSGWLQLLPWWRSRMCVREEKTCGHCGPYPQFIASMQAPGGEPS